MATEARSTTTLFERRGIDDPTASVVGLRVLPGGPCYDFEAFRIESQVKRILVIGAEAGCDVVIEDEAVSGLHCLVERHGPRAMVHDCESKNGTLVNGVMLRVGELTPGTLLTLGRTSLVAYGLDGPHNRVTLPAASLDEFLTSAVNTHGSLRGAAEALGLPYSTLRGWLRKRFGRTATRRR